MKYKKRLRTIEKCHHLNASLLIDFMEDEDWFGGCGGGGVFVQ